MDSERLGAIPLFSTLPREELGVLARLAEEQELAEGEVVMAEGDFGHCLFAIESGTTDLTSEGETNRTLGPGEVIGEVAVLAAGRRSATIVSSSPMRLISFFKRDVWALDDEAPEAARRLRELIGTRTMPASS